MAFENTTPGGVINRYVIQNSSRFYSNLKKNLTTKYDVIVSIFPAVHSDRA